MVVKLTECVDAVDHGLRTAGGGAVETRVRHARCERQIGLRVAVLLHPLVVTGTVTQAANWESAFVYCAPALSVQPLGRGCSILSRPGEIHISSLSG